MRDEVIALLTAPEPVRTVAGKMLKQVICFFKARFEMRLQIGARRHPLGFFYATEELSDRMMLRYHLWPSDWAIPMQEQGNEVHDHVYELNSLLLHGAIRHETFEMIPADEGRLELFNVTYTDEGSALSNTCQRIELQTTTDSYYVAGTAYRLGPGVLHRVTPEQLPIATLVLTIRSDAAAAARVAVERGKPVATGFPRTSLTVQEAARIRTALGSLMPSMRGANETFA
jgi:hypothetical protein